MLIERMKSVVLVAIGFFLCSHFLIRKSEATCLEWCDDHSVPWFNASGMQKCEFHQCDSCIPCLTDARSMVVNSRSQNCAASCYNSTLPWITMKLDDHICKNFEEECGGCQECENCKPWCNTTNPDMPWVAASGTKQKCSNNYNGCGGCHQCQNCSQYCFTYTIPWTTTDGTLQICSRNIDNCGGCEECEAHFCKSWCFPHSLSWDTKCTWKENCGDCDVCSQTNNPVQTATTPPTIRPTLSVIPSVQHVDPPTSLPTKNPNKSPTETPTAPPSNRPTQRVSVTKPAVSPVGLPTSNPSRTPTQKPSVKQTVEPSPHPIDVISSDQPSIQPTKASIGKPSNSLIGIEYKNDKKDPLPLYVIGIAGAGSILLIVAILIMSIKVCRIKRKGIQKEILVSSPNDKKTLPNGSSEANGNGAQHPNATKPPTPLSAQPSLSDSQKKFHQQQTAQNAKARLETPRKKNKLLVKYPSNIYDNADDDNISTVSSITEGYFGRSPHETPSVPTEEVKEILSNETKETSAPQAQNATELGLFWT